MSQGEAGASSILRPHFTDKQNMEQVPNFQYLLE